MFERQQSWVLWKKGSPITSVARVFAGAMLDDFDSSGNKTIFWSAMCILKIYFQLQRIIITFPTLWPHTPCSSSCVSSSCPICSLMGRWLLPDGILSILHHTPAIVYCKYVQIFANRIAKIEERERERNYESHFELSQSINWRCPCIMIGDVKKSNHFFLWEWTVSPQMSHIWG